LWSESRTKILLHRAGKSGSTKKGMYSNRPMQWLLVFRKLTIYYQGGPLCTIILSSCLGGWGGGGGVGVSEFLNVWRRAFTVHRSLQIIVSWCLYIKQPATKIKEQIRYSEHHFICSIHWVNPAAVDFFYRFPGLILRATLLRTRSSLLRSWEVAPRPTWRAGGPRGDRSASAGPPSATGGRRDHPSPSGNANSTTCCTIYIWPIRIMTRLNGKPVRFYDLYCSYNDKK
jgi:hypothetical protein